MNEIIVPHPKKNYTKVKHKNRISQKIIIKCLDYFLFDNNRNITRVTACMLCKFSFEFPPAFNFWQRCKPFMWFSSASVTESKQRGESRCSSN